MHDRNDEGLNWFYVRGGRRQGPFDRRGLLEALLLLDAPESVLVWRSGLKAWATAGALDELRDELPPPVPKEVSFELTDPEPEPPPPLPTENGKEEAVHEAAAIGEAKDEGDLPIAGQPAAKTGTDEAGRRRRHRKRRYRESSLRPYALRLVVILTVLALVLWLLLRRLDEAPPGSIILKEGYRGSGASSGLLTAACRLRYESRSSTWIVGQSAPASPSSRSAAAKARSQPASATLSLGTS